MKEPSDILNDRAIELEESGRLDEAIECYRQAISADPQWAVPWYNLGLLHKRRRRWLDSLKCNQTAVALNPEDESAWWNLGIAATALEDWPEARRAWKACEIELPGGTGPPEMDLGATPVRINPDGEAEVIWCRRIDPARAIISSVPLPESGHRFGDLVLHDGAANGYRAFGHHKFPVFDELQVLYPSEYGTYQVSVIGVEGHDLDPLLGEIEERGDLAVEDWSTLRMICKACSEDRSENEAHIHDEDQSGERRLGIAARSEDQVRELIKGWKERLPEAEFSEIECLVEPALVN